MYYAFFMGMGQRRADLRAVAEDLFYRQWTLSNQIREGMALDIFHSDEHLASVFTNFVNRADIWVIQNRCGARFALETSIDLRCVSHGLRKKLEGHGAIKRGVFRFINRAHATTAQGFENTVVRDELGRHGKRRRGKDLTIRVSKPVGGHIMSHATPSQRRAQAIYGPSRFEIRLALTRAPDRRAMDRALHRNESNLLAWEGRLGSLQHISGRTATL